MQSLMHIAPISDLRTRSKQILAQLANSPIVLTLRGRPTAVLIDYTDYNELLNELESAKQQAGQPSLSLADAAALLLEDYSADDELTAFSILDGNPFHATE